MWLVYWDWTGLLCVAVAWLVMGGSSFIVQMFILRPWFKGSWIGILHTVIFQTLVFLMFYTHLKTALTDPGSVQCDTATEEDAIQPNPELPPRRYCRKCKCLKPARAAHCSVCHRCIQKMDHHCPWVNNCVGQNNQKFFIQFIIYVLLGSAYATILYMWRAVVCLTGPAYKTQCGPISSWGNILSIVGFVVSVVFAVFVGCMLESQWDALVTNTTGIEVLKGWQEEDISIVQGLTTACGQKFSWKWLLPMDMPPSAVYKWSPSDNKDSIDPRDPLLAEHRRIRRAAAAGSPAIPLGPMSTPTDSQEFRDSGSDTDGAWYEDDEDGGDRQTQFERRNKIYFSKDDPNTPTYGPAASLLPELKKRAAAKRDTNSHGHAHSHSHSHGGVECHGHGEPSPAPAPAPTTKPRGAAPFAALAPRSSNRRG